MATSVPTHGSPTSPARSSAFPYNNEPFSSSWPMLFAISRVGVFGIDDGGVMFRVLDGLLRIRRRGQIDCEVVEGGYAVAMYAPDQVLLVTGYVPGVRA